MCLLAVRSRESRQHAPDLKLDGRRVARVLAQSAEVTLHAGCCLALLKGLRPVGEFSVPKQQPAFAVLQEHHRDFHLSIEAWIQFIFQPTADHLANLEEETDIAILDDFDDNLLNRLQTRIRELEGRLNDAYRQNGWDDVQPLDPTAMPARAPWVCTYPLHPFAQGASSVTEAQGLDTRLRLPVSKLTGVLSGTYDGLCRVGESFWR